MASPVPVAPAGDNKSFIDRELHGASFLTLEHIAHMVLVVVVPGIVLSAIVMALTMWCGANKMSPVLDMAYYYGGSWVGALGAIGLAAALLTLIPLLLLLGRRTRAEWRKRPAFTSRLAYKIPLYSALAAITAAILGCKIQILTVLLATLAFIGVPDAPYATIYFDTFLPACIGLVLFGAAWWYVFKKVKGVDYGKIFSIALAIIGIATAVALFITAVVLLHSPGTNFNPSSSGQPVPGMYGNPYNISEELNKSYR